MKGTAGQIEAAVMARAQEGARRLGFIIISGIFFLIAAGFLTAAAWIAIEDATNALIAALYLGGFYLLSGIVLVVVARKPKGPKQQTPEPRPEDHRAARSSPYPQMAEAFVAGMDTAARLRRSRERR